MALQVIKSCPLFASVSPATQEGASKEADVLSVAAGAVLLREGEKADFLYFLMSGMVELSRLEGQRDCSVMILNAGDVFLPVVALFEEPCLVSARALTKSKLLRIKASALRELAFSDHLLSLELLRLVSGQWRMIVRHILDLKCRTAPQRLASLLVRIVDTTETSTAEAQLPFSKRQLATRVGMSAEGLSRSLQVLADNGLHVRGKKIIVRDRSAIDAFCGSDPYPESGESNLGVYAL